MKIICRFFLIICISISFFDSNAQSENLDDLVPFRKGNKWGIVHHDMKPFYPATLDSVLMQYSGGNKGSVFLKNDANEIVAQVIVKGEAMYLTTDKKLKPANFMSDEIAKDEISIDHIDQEGLKEPKSETLVLKFTTPLNKKEIEIRSTSVEYRFYIDGVHFPELDCNGYLLDDKDLNKSEEGVLLRRENSAGFANLETGKLTVPFEYQQLQTVRGNSNWLVATKTVYKGIITKQNKKITALKYMYLVPVYYEKKYRHQPFIAGNAEEGGRFFLFVEKDSSSKARYDDLYEWPIETESGPIFLAQKNNKYGFITASDKMIVPFAYDNTVHIDGRFTLLQKNNKYGFIDFHNRNFRKEPIYDEIQHLFDLNFKKSNLTYTIMLVKKNNLWFYVDHLGKEFISK